MNAISRMSVSLLICGCACASAGASNNAGEAQVTRLAAAAWKEDPASVDVTLYRQQREAPKSVDEIRQMWEAVFSRRQQSETGLSDYELQRRKKSIEINVERTIKEQEVGRWFKERIRISGDRRRIDQTYIMPQVILAQGGDPNKFEPEAVVGLNDPCDLTSVSVPDEQRGGYTHFTYSHTTATKNVQISNRKSPGVVNFDSVRLFGLPGGVRLVLQSVLGVKENTPNGVFYVPDAEKLEKLERARLDEMSVGVCRDPEEPGKRDRIEIKIPGSAAQAGVTLICAKEDYSQVYYFETRDPTSGRVLVARECNDFDSQGFPHRAVTIEYNSDGSLKRKQVYVISKVKLNPDITDEVFEFKPPDDYSVSDLRLTPVEQKTAEADRLEAVLNSKLWKDRLLALTALRQILKEDPVRLRGIAEVMLNDEHPAIRQQASKILEEIGSEE